MVARENYLRLDDKGSLDSLEALMKKRDDLDKAITDQVITANTRIPIITISNNDRNPAHECGFMICMYFNSHLLFT